ncbi:MAG: pentapeptide repeat-containing protein [Candidatus Aminicenantes bacterium]|nr:pentapeptide repeat-containing protein [Candidatus Aminicenantes bacterium]
MKSIKILVIVALLLLPAWSFAKSQVQASQIIAQIDQGKAVRYSDVEIVGTLDLTSIKDRQLDERHRGAKGLFHGSSLTYWSHARVPVVFSRCVFRGDVLAYVHDDDENKTTNVVFHEETGFQECEFQGRAHFKYVKFKKATDFNKTTFRSEALFKYTTFSTDVRFADSRFQGDANFKYVDFPGSADYANADFRREANFKYAKFPTAAFTKVVFQDEANFKYAKFRGTALFAQATFKGLANFKYAEFSEDTDLGSASFEDDTEFKYTKVRGRSFTEHLLKKR